MNPLDAVTSILDGLSRVHGDSFSTSDIAYVHVTADEMQRLPGELQWCAFKNLSFKRIAGIEYRLAGVLLPAAVSAESYRTRIAWQLTKNTRRFFPVLAK